MFRIVHFLPMHKLNLFVNIDLPSTMERCYDEELIHLKPEMEETYRNIHKALYEFEKNHMVLDKLLILGENYYKDLCAYTSFRSHSKQLLFMDKFLGMDIIVVPDNIIQIVPKSPTEALGLFYWERKGNHERLPL